MTKKTNEAEAKKPVYISISTGEIVEPKETEKILKVHAKELEHENKKFYGFNVIKKNGDKLQLKFTRNAKNIPTSEGTHFILVSETDVNIDTWSKVYPIMWCKNVLDILHFDDTTKRELVKESLKDF